MKSTKLIYIWGAFVFTILFVLAYLIFNVFDINHSEHKLYELTIMTESHVKQYDGERLTHPVWHIRSGTLREGDTIIPVMVSGITDPGSVENEIGITILNEDGYDVTSNYVVDYDFGHLTVRPLSLSIQTMSQEKTYDGTPLSDEEWTIQSGGLFDGHRIEYVMNASITDPGSVENSFYATILNEENQDVSHLYDISYQYGTLLIEPLVITLQSLSDSKVFDGEPLSRNEWEWLDGTLLDRHELFVVVDGEIENIGTVDNNIYAYVVDDRGNNVSHFYRFEYFVGKLTILSDMYGSGDLSREADEGSPEEVFRFRSTMSGPIYFRDRAWGDYNLSGWDAGIPHQTGISTHPLRFGGLALLEAGKSSSTIQMEYAHDHLPYLLPYFSVDDLDGSNDIHVSGFTGGTIGHEWISYSFDHQETIALQNPGHATDEATYRNFVDLQYLTIPERTRQDMLALAIENGLSQSSDELVTDVQTYIRNAATYNLNFETIPDHVEDLAVYFLTTSKEGICQHYATAAVLMYRALGIPARYVTGYLGISESDAWVSVTGQYAHAWVEIYVDGFGWMPIEVTAGGPADSGGNGDEPPEELTSIFVKPRRVTETYAAGKVIRASEITLTNFDSFIEKGYTYDVTFEGELSTPGRIDSEISSFVIYDEHGDDVTDMFDITFGKGMLKMYLHEIELITDNDQKTYDGTPLVRHSWSMEGELGSGHYVEQVIFDGEQTDVGISKNSARLLIFDEVGQDVTDLYKIDTDYGDLWVIPRYLQIRSGSATKTFDGISLVNSTYEITEGTLVETHRLDVMITGSQTSVGVSTNNIESIRVFDASGEVTDNYSIEIIEGELVVNPKFG